MHPTRNQGYSQEKLLGQVQCDPENVLINYNSKTYRNNYRITYLEMPQKNTKNAMPIHVLQRVISERETRTESH